MTCSQGIKKRKGGCQKEVGFYEGVLQTNKTQENTSEMDGAGPDPQEITDKNLAHVNW